MCVLKLDWFCFLSKMSKRIVVEKGGWLTVKFLLSWRHLFLFLFSFPPSLQLQYLDIVLHFQRIYHLCYGCILQNPFAFLKIRLRRVQISNQRHILIIMKVLVKNLSYLAVPIRNHMFHFTGIVLNLVYGLNASSKVQKAFVDVAGFVHLLACAASFSLSFAAG